MRMTQADSNTAWQMRVHTLMGQGLGVEDIAASLACRVDDVRREAEILQCQGKLDEIYARWRR